MTNRYLIVAFVFLTGCQSDPGQDNAWAKDFWLFLIVVIVVGGIIQSQQRKEKQVSEKLIEDEFRKKFISALLEKDFHSINVIYKTNKFGFAINDTLQNIAIYSTSGSLVFLDKAEITTSKVEHFYTDIITSKTKMPLVSMTPRAKTIGTSEKIYSYSIITITTNNSNILVYTFPVSSKIDAEKVNALLNKMINQNVQPTQSITIYSIADEIAKLKKLLDDGIITQAEFDAQKKKLLSQ